ncbi:MAG: XRE family transcriptional regulator, partial [Paracoccaceae bacterium]
ACPLWPLYQALARPMAPVQAQVQTAGPSGARFLALAWCQPHLPRGFSGPELRSAAMLILPDPDPRPDPRPEARFGEVLAVGSTCRICPRGDCPARREPSITSEGV